MFKSVELPFLVQFFHMFYNDKPVDWLLDHLIQTKICNWEKHSVSMRILNKFLGKINECNYVVSIH